jgi:hypothetical protein
MTCQAAICHARLRRAGACLLMTACLLVPTLLGAARPAAAAPRQDPSYSPSAQREASLNLGLLGAATFDPDNLISDVNFTAVDSLSRPAVQTFLAAQSGTLDTYRALDHSGVKRNAAGIIWRAAQAWQVSPKVILVTLQKEEGLLSAAQPSATALAWAMGCGVPDSGSRNTAYKGFGNQVWYGAESLHNDGQGFSAGIAKVCGDGTVKPANQASYALYRYTPWIGVAGGGNKLFWTLYWQYFGDPLAGDAVAPTTSVTGADGLWHDEAVTLTFSAVDNTGGSGVACTQYKLDSGSWTAATTLTIAAPASHAGDGSHTIAYRSVDDAGNTETAHTCHVDIDTRRPRVVANWTAKVTSGQRASLRYYVGDPRPGSPTADVTIRVITSAGHLVKKLEASGAAVNERLTAKFVCRLPAGRYRFRVFAVDAAGNTQSKVASSLLTVR